MFPDDEEPRIGKNTSTDGTNCYLKTSSENRCADQTVYVQTDLNILGHVQEAFLWPNVILMRFFLLRFFIKKIYIPYIFQFDRINSRPRR